MTQQVRATHVYRSEFESQQPCKKTHVVSCPCNLSAMGGGRMGQDDS